MNKIGVLLGKDNETISFAEVGRINIFLKEEGRWQVVQETLFTIDGSMGLRKVREHMIEIAKSLGDCKIIIGKKVEGIAYNVFESFGFSIWEFEGPAQNFLDYVIEKEDEIQKEQIQSPQSYKEGYIEKLNEDYYQIDLEEAQLANRNLSSKQILIPVLQNYPFKRLDIICSHIPPWIEKQIDNYRLEMQTENLCGGNYKVTLQCKESY